MDDEAAGVPEWVVTYGDMMSLLLTFFIMLVSLSEVVADQKYRAILESLQQYVGYRTSAAAPPGKNFPLDSLVSAMETLGSFSKNDSGRGGIKTPALEGNDFRVFRSREGKMQAVGEPIIFELGGIRFSEEAGKQLLQILSDLAGKPNKIEIRGHTSTEPLPSGSEFVDKRVLSYERARKVLQFLEMHGVEHDRMRVTAVGDTEPLTFTGDKRTLQLDRVEVRILDAFAREFIGPREVPE